MRVLVTGAGGFIGRSLTRTLLDRGDDVTSVVHNRGAAGSRLFRVSDISGKTEWGSALEGVDVVVHLAAHVHVLDRRGAADLARFRSVNADGTAALAMAAARAGVRRFVYMSTVGVHGLTSGARPLRESDPVRPATPYALSKWEGEEHLRRVCSGSSMEWTILRAPLVYGPGVEAKFLQLLSAVRRGVPMPFASIKNTRSMLFAGNLVDATVAALTAAAVRNAAFLVADNEAWSTPALVRELARLIAVQPRLIPFPPALLRIGAKATGQWRRVQPLVESLVVETTPFRQAARWEPPFTSSDGLAATVAGDVGGSAAG